MPRIVDQWSGGASAFRQNHFRVVEDGGVYRFELLVGEDWLALAKGHTVAHRIAELLIEEDEGRTRNISKMRRNA